MNDNRYFISASAGTGKTTRLLEDVMSDLLARSSRNVNASIRESLTITFTVAAATELRAKLNRNLEFAVDYAQSLTAGDDPQDTEHYIGGEGGALTNAIRQHPEQAERVFAKAVNELPTAQISTIDALNKHIVDRNADALDIDPGYQILTDEAIRDELRRRVATELFAQWYDPESPEHDAFLDLLDNTGGADHDDTLATEILRLYDQAQTKPNGLEWLSTLSEPYQARFADTRPVRGISWLTDDYADEQHGKLEQLRQSAATMLAELANDGRDGMQLLHDCAAFRNVFAALDDVYAAYDTGSWDDVISCLAHVDDAVDQIKAKPDGGLYSNLDARYEAVVQDVFPTIGKGTDGNKIAMDTLKTVVQHAAALRELFALPANDTDALNAVAERRIDMLVRTTEAFAARYDAEKQRLALQDFSDIAHLAIQALRMPDVLRRANEQWQYIYVDECQDNNALQNEFIDLIGRDAAKVTMVGDVKQSIYGFRYAQPEEFRKKSREVTPEHQSTLVRNFRSVPEILIFANTVFDHLMHEDMGGADYLQDRFQLNAVPQQYDAAAVELLIRQLPDDDSGDDADPSAEPSNVQLSRSSKNQQQVDMIVRRIHRLHDEEGYQYGDIAILERSSKLFTELYDALIADDVPVEIGGVGDYYKKPEILIALDWLRAIDNPHRDVPLVALLRAFGITDNALAIMRLPGRGCFYDILRRIARQDNASSSSEKGDSSDDSNAALPNTLDESTMQQLTAFLDTLENFRDYAAVHPIDELLWHIYTETGWYDYCGQLPDGKQRQANLTQLCAKARTFENTGERGVHAFLDAVDQWAQNDDKEVNEEASTQPTKDAVHITSIHQAKGLQWKVVILADSTSDVYNERNVPQYVTIPKPGDPNHGIAACNLLDGYAQVKLKTFQREQIAKMVYRQSIEEQLRLLYVALTRPERKLIIAGVFNQDPETELQNMLPVSVRDDGTVEYDSITGSERYLNWIVSALWAGSKHTAMDDGFGYRAVPSDGTPDGLLNAVMPVPDGLDADSVAGNAASRLISWTFDCSAIAKQSEGADPTETSAVTAQRPSAAAFVSVDQRVPDRERIPVTINASGIRSWAELTAPPELDDDDDADSSAVSGEAVVRDDADERSWRFSSYPLPDFLTNAGHGLSAAEIGTGVHNVLEQFDWSTPPDTAACAEQLRKVIHRLEMTRIISTAAAREIEHGPLFDGMMWFVCPNDEATDDDGDADAGTSLPVGIRSHRGRLFREAPFSLLLDDCELREIANPNGSHGSAESGSAGASDISADAGIVVRGVIDGYYVDDETRSIVLFDYKTDAVWDEERDDPAHWERRLHDDYVGQQTLYAKALERLYPGYAVTQRWLVGLAGHRFIDVAK